MGVGDGGGGDGTWMWILGIVESIERAHKMLKFEKWDSL